MTNITITSRSSGDVSFDSVMYWQSGMSTWEYLPNSISDKETYFAVYWMSKASGTVCGFVDLEVNGTKLSPVSGYGDCVSSAGRGKSVKFTPIHLSGDVLLQVIVSDSKVTPTPTPIPTPTPLPVGTRNIALAPHSHGKVQFDSILYWQEGMAKWEYLPKVIPNKETQFAVYWLSNDIGTVCGYVNLEINGIGVAPIEGQGDCVTTVYTGKAVKFTKVQLPADARLRIDVCDSKECPPIIIVCRKGCIPDTFTLLTGKLIDGVCERIPNSPECGFVGDVGYIKCQAYDSVTNAGLAATVQIDGITVAPTTPFTTRGLSPGLHRITFIHEGYITRSMSKTVVLGETINAYGSMVKEALLDVPGFDIKINIPGLLPKSSLHIEQVVKVPFTDTWWDSPIGHAVRWDNIGNGVYKARGRSADSSPTPSYHIGFEKDEDYAVYVGTSAVAFYPGSIVHRSTGKVTEIDLTSSYIDWVSSKVCTTFGISPANCPFFIATSVNDAAFLLELWSIITKHENLAGEHTLPTALDYALIPVAIFGLFSPGISEGAIASMIGKRFGKLIELSKKGVIDAKEIAQDPRLSTFMLRATDSQFSDLVLHLEEGNLKTAKILLGVVENISPTNLELNALDRAVKLTKKTDESLAASNSVEKLPTVLSKFSDKFAEIYASAVKWATAHPFESVFIGIAAPAVAAIAYIMDNSSINFEKLVKTKGIKAGDTSWTAKNYIDVIDTYMFNVKDAEKVQNWDAFCENLALWKAEVDKLKAFILVNGTTLRAEGTYDVLESSIQAYYKAIELKEEVHTCVPIALPEKIIAEVIEILDNDTVRIKYNNSEYTVRLLGINAPEGKTYDYTCTGVRSPFLIRRLVTPGKECIEEETWTGTEELYNASKVWLGQNLPVHQTAIFNSDAARQFDKYGRLLAVPFYGGKNVCMESLKAGYSVVFFYDYNKQVNTGAFLAAEKTAKDAKVGVWAIVAGTGTIRCVSNPTAAEVWLDGTYTGKKTISSVAYLSNIPVGIHTVEFKKIIDGVSHACSRSVGVTKDQTALASCTLVSGVTPTPTPIPGVTPTPTPAPTEATWYIGYAKDVYGAVLTVAKVHVDSAYIGHYAPELVRFCDGCRCDNVVPCGFGSHTITIKRTGYKDWVKTRVLGPGDAFTDNPVLQLISEDTFPVQIKSYPVGAIIKVDGKQV